MNMSHHMIYMNQYSKQQGHPGAVVACMGTIVLGPWEHSAVIIAINRRGAEQESLDCTVFPGRPTSRLGRRVQQWKLVITSLDLPATAFLCSTTSEAAPFVLLCVRWIFVIAIYVVVVRVCWWSLAMAGSYPLASTVWPPTIYQVLSTNVCIEETCPPVPSTLNSKFYNYNLGKLFIKLEIIC